MKSLFESCDLSFIKWDKDISHINGTSHKGANTMQRDPKSTPKFGFYRLHTVLEIIPVSRSAWWAGIKAGRFPAGVKIAPRTTAWRQSDIEDLCARLEKEGK